MELDSHSQIALVNVQRDCIWVFVNILVVKVQAFRV
jgi:hypothetical protein